MLLACGLGTGYVPGVPGTLGTALGAVLTWAMLPLGWFAYAVVALILVAVGVPLSAWAARRLGKEDPSQVVYDELVSMPIVFFLVSWQSSDTWWVLLVGFLAHRVFDIAKPWPANRLEHLPSGWGIMADDVAAAVYAQVVLRAMLAWFG